MLGIYERWPVGTDPSALEGIRVAKPKGIGMRWKGTAHYKLIAAMNDHLKNLDLKTDNLRYYLSANEMDIVCSCNIYLPEAANGQNPNGLIPSFGFAASNSRRRGLRFYCGVSAPLADYKFVCSRWRGHPYTIRFSAEKQMQTALNEWRSRHEIARDMVDRLRRLEMTESRIDKVVMEAGYRNLMPWSRVGKIAESMTRHRSTAWNLVLEFGRMSELNPPRLQMDQQYEFVNLLRELYPAQLGEVEEEVMV